MAEHKGEVSERIVSGDVGVNVGSGVRVSVRRSTRVWNVNASEEPVSNVAVFLHSQSLQCAMSLVFVTSQVAWSS